MQVKDIMTTGPITATPEETVAAVAKTMAARRISGLPVVDAAGAVVGVVSEGDLLARAELGREASRSWWADIIGGSENARDYVRAHGRTVADVMTRPAKTIAPDASLAALALMLETNGVKRLPVVADGKLVGIVSRADVVRALASLQTSPPPVAASDNKIRRDVLSAFQNATVLTSCQATVLVRDGVVELWGLAPDQNVIDAARVVAEEIAGVKRVENRIALFPNTYFA